MSNLAMDLPAKAWYKGQEKRIYTSYKNKAGAPWPKFGGSCIASMSIGGKRVKGKLKYYSYRWNFQPNDRSLR